MTDLTKHMLDAANRTAQNQGKPSRLYLGARNRYQSSEIPTLVSSLQEKIPSLAVQETDPGAGASSFQVKLALPHKNVTFQFHWDSGSVAIWPEMSNHNSPPIDLQHQRLSLARGEADGIADYLGRFFAEELAAKTIPPAPAV